MDLFTIVQLLQSLWVAFIVIMLFYRFRIGVASYLAYIFLVPYMKIDIEGFVLQWNFINILLLIAFLYYRYKKKLLKFDWCPLLPFVIYFGVSLIVMPFQDGLPFSESINTWRVQVMKYLILPFVIWNDIIINHNSLKLYRKVLIGCIVIATLYGLFLTTMPGVNPYVMVVSEVNGEGFNMAYAAGHSGMVDDGTLDDDMIIDEDIVFRNDNPIVEDRLFGRISSVFSHPMMFGLFLGLALLYLYRNKGNISKRLLYVMSLIILTDMLLCGVRSVIVATSVVGLFYLFYLRKFKIFFTFLMIGGALWIITTFSPWLSNYLGSIFDEGSSNVSGSSLEMRLSQLEGCFVEIKDAFLEGKGFGWVGYYLSQNEGHPTILHFESLIFVVICNSGMVGVLLWFVMGTIILKYNNRRIRPIAALLHSLFIFYIAYACITGEYGYMQYFIIFYILMLGEDLYMKRANSI